MKNKMTIYFMTENSKESRKIYDLIQELIEKHIIHSGITDKIQTELNSNIK